MKNINNLIVILASCFFLSNSFSQQSFPTYTDTAKWNVLECFWTSCDTYTYTYDYDTTFCGNTYSKVYFPEQGRNGYFRNEGLKTYFRKSTDCGGKEYLIYDFSMNLGDTVFVGYDVVYSFSGIDTTKMLLESIETLNDFGVERARFKLKFDAFQDGQFNREMYWIQGIGSETHPFYSFYCLTDNCEQSFQTLCYDSSTVQLFQNTWANTCDTTLAIAEFSENIEISPNPFDNIIQVSSVQTPISNLIFYNNQGELITNFAAYFSTTFSIATDFLSAGIYFVTIETAERQYNRKLVKIE